jgi:hypothetical protein
VYVGEDGTVESGVTLSKLDEDLDKFRCRELVQGAGLSWKTRRKGQSLLESYTLPRVPEGAATATTVFRIDVGAVHLAEPAPVGAAAVGEPLWLTSFDVDVYCKQDGVDEKAKVWARMLVIAVLLSQGIGLGGGSKPVWFGARLSRVVAGARRLAKQA